MKLFMLCVYFERVVSCGRTTCAEAFSSSEVSSQTGSSVCLKLAFFLLVLGVYSDWLVSWIADRSVIFLLFVRCKLVRDILEVLRVARVILFCV